MNRSNNGSGRGARLELQLNLLPPPAATAERMDVDGGEDDYSSDSSSPSSCVSSEGSPSGGGKSPMVIGACTRCLLYCMVAKKDYPTCINCKQPCLVDLLSRRRQRRQEARQTQVKKGDSLLPPSGWSYGWSSLDS